MADRIASKRFPGVYFRESKAERFRGKPVRIYWITYRSSTGRQLWERIGKSSEDITEEFANRQRVDRINLINHGGSPKTGKRAVTLKEIFESYIENAKADGKHTGPEQNRYDRHLDAAFGRLAIEEITPAALTKHKAALLESLSPGSVKHIFALLRRAINYGVRKGIWQGANPVGQQADFAMPKVQNAGERFLTRPEADALLDELAKRSPMVRDMGFVAIKTGLRATELFGLRGKDLDPTSWTIYVDAKGGKRQPVYAGKEVMATLQGYGRAPGEFIFQRRDGGRLKEVYAVFARAVDALKLNEGVTDKRHKVWFHVFRHTFISWLAQSGKFDLLELKEAARHERIETTMRYAHLIPGGVRDKLAKMDQDESED